MQVAHMYMHIPVIESLKDIGAHPRASASSYGVAQHKTFQTVAVVSFSVQDVEYLLCQPLCLDVVQCIIQTTIMAGSVYCRSDQLS